MLILKILNAAVRTLNYDLTREQRKMLMCDYSDIDKVPQEIRDLIIDRYLQEGSPLRSRYIQCGITDLDDMVDNMLRYLYLAVNYIPKEEWEEGLIL